MSNMVKRNTMTKEQQFELVIKENSKTIYSVCRMFSLSSYECDDLFQEILIRLWLGFDSFRQDCKPTTWIYRVSLNVCLNIEKRERLSLNTIPLTIDVDCPDDNSEKSKQIEELYEMMNKLRLVDKAFLLLWLDDVSYDEISDIMGISKTNVGV